MRIIPLLLHKDNDSFKGINYQNHIYLGDILNQIRILNDYEVDELVILNIKNKFNKKENLKLIKKLSFESDFAISIGGGVDNFDYAKKILNNGADKIILNSTIFNNYKLVEKISTVYGSQAVSIKLDVIKDGRNFFIFNKNKKIFLSDLIDSLNNLNFSELIISDVSRDGTGKGLNTELIEYVTKKSKKLNLFSGGLKDFNELKKLSNNRKISCIIVGTYFSLYGNLKTPLIHYLNDQQKKQIRKI